MRNLYFGIGVAAGLMIALPAAAQLNCTIVINSPEDKLMLAVNGADTPQEQVTALDQYVQANPTSTFMPCVNSAYTTAYLKLSNFDKAAEYGEKNFAAKNMDISLMLNLLRAYVAGGKATETAFAVIAQAPQVVQRESQPARAEKMSDADFQKVQQDYAEQVKDARAYAEYAFFQLLPRLTDPNQRIQQLDAFMKAYPDTTNVGQVNYQYFVAYEYAGNPAKADEYGEKAIAGDPSNVEYLDAVANDYATRQVNLDKAVDYARKVLDLVPAMKKPEGTPDDQFKAVQNNQEGLAHITLGYVTYQRAAKTKKVAPAIQDFKTAVDQLGANAELQAKALYFLGSAYEFEYPPNHKAAIDALTRATNLQSSFQEPARQLLAKVKTAAHVK